MDGGFPEAETLLAVPSNSATILAYLSAFSACSKWFCGTTEVDLDAMVICPQIHHRTRELAAIVYKDADGRSTFSD
jgi:hypothetical protein